jgi:hypothetical protein
MTASDGTRAHQRLQAALDAKEHERDVIAAPGDVDELSPKLQDEWDVLNDEVSDLRVAEESVRENTDAGSGG